MTQEPKLPSPQKCAQRRLVYSSIAVVVVVVVAISLGLYFGLRPRAPQNPSPTVAPAPLLTAAPSSTRQAQLLSLLSSVSPLLFIDGDDSPQRLAFDWLLTDTYSEEMSNDRIIQRFALATLWHSTNGSHWKHGGWLEPRDECQWGEVMEDEEEDYEADVRCSSNHVVVELSLCCTSLQGELPPQVGLLTGLTSLIFGSNLLTGSPPTELGSLGNLTRLILDNNQFQGAIPTELAQLTHLESLYLDNNQFSSSVPSELADLTRLRALFLKNNRLSGTIPTELGLLSNLVWFPLHINDLTGEIPTEFGGLTQCTTLSLFDNELSGRLPSELGQLTRLVYFSVAQNVLTGAIPTQIESLTLAALYLEDNHLTGSLAASLCSNLTLKNTLRIDCDEVVCDCCANGAGEACEEGR